MILVTKAKKEELDSVGLLKYKTIGMHAQEQNFVVLNKEHMSRDKSYYVCEEPDILAFLEKYDSLNLQKIYPNQLNELKKLGLVSDEQIQHSGEYKRGATVFIAADGTIRCKKIAKNLIAIGVWKDNSKRNLKEN